jgi:hypothetical protein
MEFKENCNFLILNLMDTNYEETDKKQIFFDVEHPAFSLISA